MVASEMCRLTESVEGLVLTLGCHRGQIASGFLVHLDGFKEGLEVSCPEALERENTCTQLSNQFNFDVQSSNEEIKTCQHFQSPKQGAKNLVVTRGAF